MRITLVLCLLLLSIPWFSSCCAREAREGADAEPQVNADTSLLDRIIAAQAKLHSASGKFTQEIIYTKDKERKPEVYQAKLTVQVPDKYNLVFAKKDLLEYYISNGKTEWQVEMIDGEEFASQKELKDGRGKFSSLTDYIPLRRESLEKHFKLVAHLEEEKTDPKEKKQAPYCRIDLTPLTNDQKDHMKWIKIYFNKDFKVMHFNMLDANSNLYTYTVNQMEYNVKLKPETFTYNKDE